METAKIIIPKGYEAYNITATSNIGCYIEVCYELKEKYTPQFGDFIYIRCKKDEFVSIYYGENSEEIIGFVSLQPDKGYVTFNQRVAYKDDIISIHRAGEGAKSDLIAAMHEKGFDWDAANKKVIKYHWKPEREQDYWYINDEVGVYHSVWCNDSCDNERHEHGNCFKSRKEAEEMSKKIIATLRGE